MVRLHPRQTTLANPQFEQQLASVATATFAQRRKTLRNSLAGLCDTDTILAAGCDPTARAERQNLKDFVRLTEQICDGV